MMSGVRSRLMNRCGPLVVAVVSAVKIAYPQRASGPLPTFQDYAVNEVFNRPPHPPILVTREQRLFRTRIREGIENGAGVWINGEWGREQNRPGPNFAGHYIVIVWGCGTGCIRMAMSDAETGAVYNPPISAGGLALPMLMFPVSVGKAPELDYRLASRLVVIRATPHWDQRDAASYAFYFLWQAKHWTLLRRVQIEE